MRLTARCAARGTSLAARGRAIAADIANAALSLLVPMRCTLCAAPVGVGDAPLCAGCVAGLPASGPPVCVSCARESSDCEPRCASGAHGRLMAVAAFRACEPSLRLIHFLKYGGADRLTLPLGRALAACVPREWTRRTVAVVPVPLHPSRHRERGFNQSALLARVVGRELTLPVREGLIARPRRTRPQAQLDRGTRATNVDGAFRVAASQDVPRTGAILLIDDVLTSGATLRAAAAPLREAGAAEVLAATVLRA